MRTEQRLLMTMILAGCCCASSVTHADWASGIAITNEAAFFEAIDLTRKELADVRAAVAKADWPAAKIAGGNQHFESIAVEQ
jgi:hypothetical protein